MDIHKYLKEVLKLKKTEVKPIFGRISLAVVLLPILVYFIIRANPSTGYGDVALLFLSILCAVGIGTISIIFSFAREEESICNYIATIILLLGFVGFVGFVGFILF